MYLLVIFAVAVLLLSLVTFVLDWKGINRTKEGSTLHVSVSSRTATPATQALLVTSNTIQSQDDCMNGTKKMWIAFPSSLCDAIRRVETGGHPAPATAVGDGGRSIGPLQISRACWQDAREHDPAIGGRYEDCKNLEYAKRIFWAYLDRWAPNDDYETMARTWNGGPRGPWKAATDTYWVRVQRQLELGADRSSPEGNNWGDVLPAASSESLLSGVEEDEEGVNQRPSDS